MVKSFLAKLPKKQDSNLIFIFGNARSGKSFMMNCLTGVRGLFRVINSATPCTKGVDISSYVAPYNDLAHAVGQEKNLEGDNKSPKSGGIGGLFKKAFQGRSRKPPLIGFVDVEGQGAEDGMYDTMLALPLLLTSKVVLFNHKGAPTVTDMLSKLGVLARAAEYIDLSDDSKNDPKPDGEEKEKEKAEEEEEEEEKSAPKSGIGSGGKKFGHLHVLFRDFSFNADRDQVYAQLMAKEKVTPQLTKSGDNSSKAAKERNDIRDLLLQNFSSISVWLLKQPATADDLKTHAELPASLVDPEFVVTIKQLLYCVVGQMKSPTYFNGKPLTGPRLVSLMAQICTALNEGGTINVPSVYRAMEKEAVERVGNECINKFQKQIAQIDEKLPLPNEEVSAKTKVLQQAMFLRYDGELSECKLEDEKKRKKQELLTTSNRMISDLERNNANATLVKVKKIIIYEISKMRAAFEEFCEAKMPLEESKLIEVKFKELKERARALIKEGLSDLPQALTLPDFQLILVEQEEILQEFLTLQTFKNESLLKDQTIDKLHQEAIRKQELLIEQNKKLEKKICC